MKTANFAEVLWGEKAKISYLWIAAGLLLFTCLGGREIWTQEHRWADIVSGMFYRQDFLHPYLGEGTYYDKPLLSYWLIVFVAKITGMLNTWTLRIPSALAGLLALGSIYSLGKNIQTRSLGLLAAWLLLTTFYFLFWARTSSADMLNLGGSLFAIAWYYTKRNQISFYNYAVFFLIVALTSLCKGLVGAIVPCIAVFADVLLEKTWRNHLRGSLLLSLIPALMIYVLPFWASSHFGGENYSQNGLYLVYKENILRYFQPFDHQGPIYTYFIYLPVYLLPWTFFFFPALFQLKSRWKGLPIGMKWIALTLLFLFVFFTASGSRRSYYVLPMVPFAILLMADWLLAASQRLRAWMVALTIAIFSLLLVAVDIVPAWYHSYVGVNRFAEVLKQEASKTLPWMIWDVVMLDAESKLNFYLQLSPQTKNFQIKGDDRSAQTTQTLVEAWPVLQNKPRNTIFITRKRYVPLIRQYFAGYREVEIHSSLAKDMNAPVAFIPLV